MVTSDLTQAAGAKQSPERMSTFLITTTTTSALHSPVREPKVRQQKAQSLSPTAGQQQQQQQQLPAYVMREHALVAQIVLNVVGARLPTQVMAMYSKCGELKYAHAASFYTWRRLYYLHHGP